MFVLTALQRMKVKQQFIVNVQCNVDIYEYLRQHSDNARALVQIIMIIMKKWTVFLLYV